MASKRPEIDGEAIARAIAADLPGWKRAPAKSKSEDAAKTLTDAEPGASLADLRRKFLGRDAYSDSAPGAEDYGTLKRGRTTVSVQPEKGGATKTADITNGKAKIVQG